MWEGDSVPAWLTTWAINCVSYSSLVMSLLNSLNSSKPRFSSLSTAEFSLYHECCSDSRSIYPMHGSRRKESSFVRHDRGVGVWWIANSSRQVPSFSNAVSPCIFLSLGFAVILSKFFTLSVTLSWLENKARHTASSERYHKWISKALLAAMLISRSVYLYFHMSFQRDRFYPRASTASGIFGCIKKDTKIMHIDGSEFLPSLLDWNIPQLVF